MYLYRGEYRRGGASPWTPLFDWQTSTSFPWQLTGLDPGDDYFIRVQARENDVLSPWQERGPFSIERAEIPVGRVPKRVRFRLEVWNRTGTEHRADFLADDVIGLERSARLKDEESLVATVAGDSAALAYLEEGSLLILREEGTPRFTLWRLAGLTESRGQDGAFTAVIDAEALWMDFRHGRIRQTYSTGRIAFNFSLRGRTAARYLQEYTIPGYDGDFPTFELGVVEPTGTYDIGFEKTTPLGGLRRVEENAKAEGFFRLKPDGSGYWLDLLTRIGVAGGGGAELLYGKNLLSVDRRTEAAEVTTRLYADGAGLLTLGDAQWTLSTFAAGVGTFPVDRNPVFADGAFAAAGGTPGLFFFVPGKGGFEITASAAGARSITVPGAPFVAGDRGWLATNAQGARLTYLESPSARALYGARPGDYARTDIPDAINLSPNGFLNHWANGRPENSTLAGSPQIAQSTDTDYARHGEKAAHVVCTAADEGLIFGPIPIEERDDRGYTAFRVGLTVITGLVRVELRGPDGTIYPVEALPVTQGRNIYLEIVSAGPVHKDKLPAGDYTLAILSHGGAAAFYLDAHMVTPIVGSEVPDFVEDSGAVLLWFATVDELGRVSRLKREYRISLLDLYREDRDRFRFDELRLGDDVVVRDPDFGYEVLRVVELREDLLTGEGTDVVLALDADLRVADDLALFLPRRRPTSIPSGAAQTPSARAAILLQSADYDPDDGLVYVSALASATSATLELYVRTSWTEPYPVAPEASIQGRTGVFPGLYVAPDTLLIYTIVALDSAGVAGDGWEASYEPALSSADNAGRLAKAPTLLPRVNLSADGAAADILAIMESPIGESMRLSVRDSDAPGAPTWTLCVNASDSSPRWVADGTELGPAAYFANAGGQLAARLSAVPLARDLIRRVYLQATGQESGLTSGWIPVALEARRQPWLESFAAVWDNTAGTIVAEVSGGAFCASVLLEASPEPDFSAGVRAAVAQLADGGTVQLRLPIVEEDRGKSWYTRAIPYNGPAVDADADGDLDSTSGLGGQPQRTPVYIPPVPLPVLLDVEPLTDPDGNWRFRTAFSADERTQSVRFTCSYFDDTGHIKYTNTVINARTGEIDPVNGATLGEGQRLSFSLVPYAGPNGTGTKGLAIGKSARRPAPGTAPTITAQRSSAGECGSTGQAVSVTWDTPAGIDPGAHTATLEVQLRQDGADPWPETWTTVASGLAVDHTYTHQLTTVGGNTHPEERRYRVRVLVTADGTLAGQAESAPVSTSYRDCSGSGGSGGGGGPWEPILMT